jgi:hypothetical protein
MHHPRYCVIDIQGNIVKNECLMCYAGYEGSRCEQNINECKVADPCQNGATCTDRDPLYECTCTEGYVGGRCQLADPCYNVTHCANNGTCHASVAASQPLNDTEVAVPLCNCTAGWTGSHCELVSTKQRYLF